MVMTPRQRIRTAIIAGIRMCRGQQETRPSTIQRACWAMGWQCVPSGFYKRGPNLLTITGSGREWCGGINESVDVLCTYWMPLALRWCELKKVKL